jgi:4'-phosphopantetheinyl transferase EntD
VSLPGIFSLEAEIRRALKGIFPSGVAFAALAVSGRGVALTPEEEAAVRGSSLERRAEFAAGRACIRAALASLGLPGASVPQEPDGSPRWPTGWVGSLSHSGDLCAAAAGPRTRFSGLGLDLQVVRALEPDRARLFCDRRERDWIEGHAASERPVATLLLFCAKESAGKCIRSLAGRTPDPLDVGIEAGELPGPFAVLMRGAGRPPHAPVPLISGRLALAAGFVLAGAEAPSPS